MSEVVTLRFVCSNEGRHKERTLLTVERWPEGPWGAAHLSVPGDPERMTPEYVQNEVLYHGAVAGMMEAGETFQRRPLLKCPHCRPRTVFSEATMLAMGKPYETFGGTCAIDVSTGAIVHKQ